MPSQIFDVSDFPSNCLDILGRLGRDDQVVITQCGKAIAVLSPSLPTATEMSMLHGFMRGSVVASGDINLTDPVSDTISP